MGILVLLLAVTALLKLEYDKNTDNFFDIKHSTSLKGLFCIIVILVHIPTKYQNSLQNIVSSFGYIGVTFFFMASAYGLKYGVNYKKDYLNHFWRNRLTSLLIPAVLVNIISMILQILYAQDLTGYSYLSLLNINNWVKVLILYYIAFYAVYKLVPENFEKGYKDLIICLFVIATSLVDKLTPLKITYIWPTESIGFIYGIILANNIEKFKYAAKKNYKSKSAILLLLSMFLGILYLKLKSVFFLGDYCLKIALGFILLFCLLHITSHFRIENKINQFLGKISYEVYLIHLLVIKFISHSSLKLSSGVYIWIVVAITILLSTVVNFASRYIIQKVKTNDTKPVISNPC